MQKLGEPTSHKPRGIELDACKTRPDFYPPGLHLQIKAAQNASLLSSDQPAGAVSSITQLPPLVCVPHRQAQKEFDPPRRAAVPWLGTDCCGTTDACLDACITVQLCVSGPTLILRCHVLRLLLVCGLTVDMDW